jgi:hypothetical protein
MSNQNPARLILSIENTKNRLQEMQEQLFQTKPFNKTISKKPIKKSKKIA